MSKVQRILVFAILATFASISCASRATVASKAAGSLAGQWLGDSPGLHLSLTLSQAGDSITGIGTYEVHDAAQIGCGGETIPATGPVSLTGLLAADTVSGRLRFSGDWSPPYRASLVGADSLKGNLMSVDRGGCSLVLTRKR
jgi:hypothetical protein